jgi:ribonucleoside-diphosphate reductase alpha chain
VDFNWPAPLDMTNISPELRRRLARRGRQGNLTNIFRANVAQALRTAEPGFSFNFGDKQNETLRNACTEVTSEDDSDVCNLGSLNMGRIESLEEFRAVVALATQFLVCGTLRAKLPYAKVYETGRRTDASGSGSWGSTSG